MSCKETREKLEAADQVLWRLRFRSKISKWSEVAHWQSKWFFTQADAEFEEMIQRTSGKATDITISRWEKRESQ